MYKQYYLQATKLADKIRENPATGVIPRREGFMRKPQKEPQDNFFTKLAKTLNDLDDIEVPEQPTIEPTVEPEAGDVGSRLLKDLQKDFGLTREQAAGVVGNLAHESGDFKLMQEIDPVVEGSRGGYGYAQWTASRRRAFEKWAEQNGMDIDSYDANYGYLKHELENTPEGKVLDTLRQAKGVEQAARIFSEVFLRPGKPNMASRVTRARRYV